QAGAEVQAAAVAKASGGPADTTTTWRDAARPTVASPAASPGSTRALARAGDSGAAADRAAATVGPVPARGLDEFMTSPTPPPRVPRGASIVRRAAVRSDGVKGTDRLRAVIPVTGSRART